MKENGTKSFSMSICKEDLRPRINWVLFPMSDTFGKVGMVFPPIEASRKEAESFLLFVAALDLTCGCNLICCLWDDTCKTPENWQSSVTILFDGREKQHAVGELADMFTWKSAGFEFTGRIPPEAGYFLKYEEISHLTGYFFDALCGSPLLGAGGRLREDPCCEVVSTMSFGHLDFSKIPLERWRGEVVSEYAESHPEFAEKALSPSCSKAVADTVIMRKICAIWSQELSLYGVHFDLHAIPGENPRNKVAEFGKLLGLQGRVDAIAEGVPFKDLI